MSHLDQHDGPGMEEFSGRATSQAEKMKNYEELVQHFKQAPVEEVLDFFRRELKRQIRFPTNQTDQKTK